MHSGPLPPRTEPDEGPSLPIRPVPRRILLLATSLLLPLFAAGCIDDSPVSPEAESAAFALLGGLEVGEALDVRGSDAGRVLLPGGESGAEFIVTPFLDDQPEESVQFRIEGGKAAGPGASDASDAPGNAAPSVRRTPDLDGRALVAPAPPDGRLHQRLREWEAGVAARGDLQRLRRHLDDPVPSGADRARDRSPADGSGQRAARTAGPAEPAPRPVPAEGELLDLRSFSDDPAQDDLCADPRSRVGRVEVVTDRAIVATDTANPATFDPGALDDLAREFDDLVWPVGARYFGTPTDIDGNERVIVFVSRVVNEQTPPGSQGVVLGFFFGGDLFPRAQCAASNEAEILYLIAPDPAGEVNGVPVSTDFVVDRGTGVIAHELQHLVNFGRRLYINEAPTAEELWLNEGLSHMAEELTFYEATGIEPRRNLDLEDVTSSPDVLEALNRFQSSNLVNYFLYLLRSDLESPTGTDAIETRGAVWALLRYLADQQEKPDEQFFRELVNSTSSGLANLRNVLESADPRDAIRTWTVAGYADDEVPDLPAFLTQPSWNFRSILPALPRAEESFPLIPRTLGPDGSLHFTVRGGGVAYARVAVPAGERATVTTTSGGGAPPSDLRISVLRIR